VLEFASCFSWLEKASFVNHYQSIIHFFTDKLIILRQLSSNMLSINQYISKYQYEDLFRKQL